MALLRPKWPLNPRLYGPLGVSTLRHTLCSIEAKRWITQEAAGIDKSKLGSPSVYFSTSLDPYFNLSLEDWLFRKTPATDPILLFYRNQSCVVIGKNQNPWKETDPAILSRHNVALIRRRSGGGTVYHDPGNINFSLLVPRNIFTRTLGAGIIEAALKERLKIDRAGVNERGDLILFDRAGDAESGWKKHISGSAYKIVSQRAYHHGTMLISSDLPSLGRFLKSRNPNLVTKSIDSVRSPVATLQSARSDVTHEDFAQAVAAEFNAVFQDSARQRDSEPRRIHSIDEQILEAGDERSEYIVKGIEELKSWDWVFGSTPEFTQEFSVNVGTAQLNCTITFKHAVVTSVDVSSGVPIGNEKDWEWLREELLGQRYADFEIYSKSSESQAKQDVLRALNEMM